ncbi:Coenzyme Q-Hypothetical protein protein COQ10 [Nesidiocoris tenuis]|uniref:Coenzyme Q-binding protein COQ10 START domain-containing protein n=1 Tax=Nesidiocoris tenuis TaxID=355587 RepID=A0ABN7AVK1_9HEMI|nr:Coenzyme Q-Hypothetical protein protein COQ10 [Nesidiocoris tenuis]
MQIVRNGVFHRCPKNCAFQWFTNIPSADSQVPVRALCWMSRTQSPCAAQNLDKRRFFTIPGTTSSKRREYVGKKIVGFSPDEMFQVVSDVENYRNFVPFCVRSDVSHRTEKLLLGRLEIGFPPLVESYVSRVTMERPNLVKADCTDGKLFDHLTTSWRFNPGPKHTPRSTSIYFYLSFEFKSALHSQLANVFFNQLVQQMESAFIREAEQRYGRPSIRTIHITPPRS